MVRIEYRFFLRYFLLPSTGFARFALKSPPAFRGKKRALVRTRALAPLELWRRRPPGRRRRSSLEILAPG